MSLLKKIKGKLFPEPAGPGSPPAWVDRLKPASFTAGNGTKVDFDYLDLRSFFIKKIGVFENVTGDGAYIQDNGVGGNRFPMLMVLRGADNDLAAQDAIRALVFRGDGVLEHPTFGTVKVVVGGEIEVVNQYVTAANQTQIICEFLETTGELGFGFESYSSLLDAFENNAANSFEGAVDLSDAADRAGFKNKIQRSAATIKNVMSGISGGIEGAQSTVDDTFDSIDSGIDLIIGQPLLIARQMQNLINTPARRRGLTRSKIEAYGNLAREIFGVKTSSNSYDKTGRNNFFADRLFAATCLSAIATATTQNDFDKKSEYIDAATEMNDLLQDFIEWSDAGITATGADDTGDGWGDLIDLMSRQISQMIAGSYAGTTEIRIVNEFDRPMIDLCFELFGSTHNDALWRFARLNDLGGDELLIIPSGREIVYNA